VPNRILKDSICQSEKIDLLSDGAECLYYRLLVQCDDYGTYKADPRIIKSVCFPLKENMTVGKTEKMLNELIGAGLLMPYEVDGKAYIYFLNWTKHQQIKNKRSRYPMPSEDDLEQYISKKERNRSEIERDRSLIQSNPIQSNPIRIQSNTNTAHAHGSQKNVKLTDDELAKLTSDFPDLIQDAIEFLSLYLVEKGDKSKAPTHNATIRRWVIDAVKEKRAKTPNKTAPKYKPNNVGNFDQREYKPSDYDDMFEKVEVIK
jgi:hypothetical protein